MVRGSESDFFMAECFDGEHNSCVFNGACFLKTKLEEATAAYLAVLDGVTLADLLPRRGADGQGAGQQLHPVQLHLERA